MKKVRILQAVLDAFGKSRLLTFDRDPATRAPTVEIAHEALLHEWGRLSEWLDESRDDLRLQRRLSVAAGSGSRLGVMLASWRAGRGWSNLRRWRRRQTSH